MNVYNDNHSGGERVIEITIQPFTVGSSSPVPFPLNGNISCFDNEQPITYWGIYLDDKYITHTSSRELAEGTKEWMEKWLRKN